MLRRILSWDRTSKAAAVCCLAPSLVTFLMGAAEASTVAWWEYLTVPIAILIMLPVLGAPQFGMLTLIRLTDLRSLKLLFLSASLAMVGWFIWFIATADLTSTSTASLALLFYPLYLAAASSVAGALLLWATNAVRRSRR